MFPDISCSMQLLVPVVPTLRWQGRQDLPSTLGSRENGNSLEMKFRFEFWPPVEMNSTVFFTIFIYYRSNTLIPPPSTITTPHTHNECTHV